MKTAQPLVHKSYLLEKFSGKGGWTYAAIPEVLQNKKMPFGWVKVKVYIDEFEIRNYKLMPMGDGRLFFPVRAEIRKKIGKRAGDYVNITLFSDETPLEIPEEILLCFENEPQKACDTFRSFTEGEQKAYLDWIYAAKKEDTRVDRIIKMVDRLMKGKKLYDQEA